MHRQVLFAHEGFDARLLARKELCVLMNTYPSTRGDNTSLQRTGTAEHQAELRRAPAAVANARMDSATQMLKSQNVAKRRH